jgi:Tfp pilus assembly protein PilV
MLHRFETTRSRPAGLTLTEALVAMFVAALGMISLLTLFPLGALQMVQALKDGRCAQEAQQADNFFRWYGAKNNFGRDANHPLWIALDRGNYTSDAPAWVASDSPQVSYPVVVDPQGWSSITTWGGTTSTNGGVLDGGVPFAFNPPTAANQFKFLPRRSIYKAQTSGNTTTYPALVNTQADILRCTMLQDDMTFSDAKTGAPASGAGAVERGGRYNAVWILQRANNSKRNLVNMTVVVMDQRAPFFSNDQTERGFGTLLGNGTQVFSPNAAADRVAPGSTSIVIVYTGAKPAISKGRWIADVTPGVNWNAAKNRGTKAAQLPNLSNPPVPPPADPGAGIYDFSPLRHLNFYRVASVNDETPGRLVIELDTPIRRNDNLTVEYGAVFMLFTGVAEVFERPPLVLE